MKGRKMLSNSEVAVFCEAERDDFGVGIINA